MLLFRSFRSFRNVASVLLNREVSVTFGKRSIASFASLQFGSGHRFDLNSFRLPSTRQRPVCNLNLVPFNLISSVPEKHHPQKGDLVYVGTLARMVRLVKLFSLSTSVVGIALQPFLYKQVSDLHWALAAMVGGVAGFFVFVTPVLLHVVTKRYVTQMYLDRNSGVFTATTYTLLLRERDHVFTAADVAVPTVPGIFTTVKIRDKVPLFIDPNLFLDRDAFVLMMKYDEPLDWEITPSQEVKDRAQETGNKK